MTASATRSRVLSLYRQLLRESNRFDSYMYRNYALRRVKDSFRQHKGITDGNTIETLMADGHRNLEIIRRQTVINRLYKSDRLVVEDVATARRT
ncbi:unnamed protein product [Oppiella nova]|uniref:Complex 1 LYR protein domain-containing protein n=2 Tax=Oppiella nova TaxID=334625 RepID=A0A7R9MHS2_9ACAR|nr:unnamed protein product [Oppiella nova]CAD7659477.1 unnamed protein product [Oppiella nova]CAG2176638.1 unnamed protein product [Oppiella nova]CAG2176639.1 unnamed protein product [Oppiella nova]